MLDLSRVTTVVVQWATIAYVVCAVIVLSMPGPALYMSQRAFHMMGNYTTVGNPMFSAGNLVVGLIFWDVVTYLGAALFVWLWNRSSTKQA